ncbi:MAG: PrsW family glutamic-type intramembrane protease [Bacillota bacterium]|nr:PrsW family glutamic-type intramembrane protease [Bacillota bacterium]
MEGHIDDRENNDNIRTKHKWFKLFLIGLATYAIGLRVLVYTQNPNLFPAVVMLGNFLIPVTYVAFFYERRRLSSINMTNTSACFFYGGFLGTFAASLLEPIFIHTFNFRDAMMVGIIEEFAKILGVLVILRHKKHDMAIDGIVLGAAAGMGFAALESSGYAFTQFLRSGGSLSATVYITMLRGILSPLGHGTWTAILAGVLFRERKSGFVRFTFNVLIAYAAVVLLHGLWDGIPNLLVNIAPSDLAAVVGEIIVGLTGLIILFVMWKNAKREARQHLTT